MNTSLVPKTINFNELVKNSTTALSLNVQTQMINLLTEEFTEEEQRWYVANLYIYMIYHPTNDFPINLEHVFKMIGFANKGNAMKTIKNNFTEGEDYKKLLFHMEKQVKNGKDLGGAGLNQETVMLNVDTFKSLCMLAKTDRGKQIRRYYVKLENIYNKIIKEEIKERERELEQQKQITKEKTQELQDKDQQLIKNIEQLKEKEKELLKEKTLRNKMLNRRCFNVPDGEYVYIYQDILDDPNSLLKIGKSTKLTNREESYSNTNKSGGIVFYMKCVDCSLIEKICHHILDKFRENKMQEWFKIDLELAKKTIKTVITIVDVCNIETTIPEISEYLSKFQNNLIKKHDDDKVEKKEIKTVNKPDDFNGFLENCCEIGSNFFTAKDELTKAFRIYTKNTIEKLVKQKLNLFLQNKFKSGVEFYENIRRNVWRGFRIKPLQFSVNDPDNITDYERFILDKCQINYSNRISYADFFDAFINYKKNEDPNYTLHYQYKQQIQNYLIDKFANGRVHLSAKSKGTHLFGVLGVSLITSSGLKDSKRTCKNVVKCNSQTEEILQSWESLTIASKETSIPRSTLSNIIKFKIIKDNFIYKYN